MAVVKIEGGVVVAVFRDVATPADALKKYSVLAGSSLQAGDHPPGTLYKAGKFTPPGEPELRRGLTPARTRAALSAELGELRWKHEAGGVEVGGVRVQSDELSQAKMKNALDLLRAGVLTGPIKFKGAAGFVDVDEPTLAAMVAAVALHVQAAYALEAEFDALVKADSLTSLAELRRSWKRRTEPDPAPA